MTTASRWLPGPLLALLLVACQAASEPPVDARPLPPPSVPRTIEPPARTFFISPRGSDDARGSEDLPWATFGHALPRLREGDLLSVGGGVYREQVTTAVLRPGSPDRRIVVQAAPGERPVVRGLLWLERPSYWTVDGLNVTWDVARNSSDQHLVKVTDGVGWVWRNSEIWGARSFSNILVASERDNEPADWALVDNCIHDTVPTNGENQDSNIYIGDMQGAGAGLIERNIVYGAPNGRNIKLGGARTAADTGPANVTVRFNTLVDAAVPIVVAGGSRNISIERNVIGRGDRGYLVRGFRLTGGGVAVAHNVGFGARAFFAADSGSLIRGDGNVLLAKTPFSGPSSCRGFRSASPDVRAAGRYASATPR